VCSLEDIVDEQALTLEGAKLWEWVQRIAQCKNFHIPRSVVTCPFLVRYVLPSIFASTLVQQVSAKWPTLVSVFVQQSCQWKSCRWIGSWEDYRGYSCHLLVAGDKERPWTFFGCCTVFRVTQSVSRAPPLGSPSCSDCVLWHTWRTSQSLQVRVMCLVYSRDTEVRAIVVFLGTVLYFPPSSFWNFTFCSAVLLMHGSKTGYNDGRWCLSNVFAWEEIQPRQLNVLVTTYEFHMFKHERPELAEILWHYMIIDEGHWIIIASCELHAELKQYQSTHRLLLIGTPNEVRGKRLQTYMFVVEHIW